MNFLSEGLKTSNFRNRIYLFSLVLASISVFIIPSCASVQSPTGGPRDTIQPKIVNETPKNLSRNFNAKEIEIEFDEFVKLSNEFTEISITPELEELPTFRAKKEILEIKFEKPLQENTTYTINFGKAIADVNESNVLKNYTYVFSTGNEIDSLSLSGTVINALTKEKLKEVTVFILPVSQDSLFGKKKASFFTTTDTSGSFALRNLREDNYRIYALNEQGQGDRIYNGQNEEIGFLPEPLVLNKNIDNIRLQVFKEVPNNFSITDRKIEPDGRIMLAFNKALAQPSIEIIESADLNKSKTSEINITRDTALVWLPEITFDSLKIAVKDGSSYLDTVIMRRTKRDTYNRNVVITDNISGAKLRPKTDLQLKFSTPIADVQQSQIVLLEDSIPVKNFQISKSTSYPRTYNLKYLWKPLKEYIIRIPENSQTDIYGNKSKLYVRRFNLDTEDNYGNMSVKINVPDTAKNYIVQWMGEKETIHRQDVITKNTTINYNTYPTAKYRIRIVYDENKNGRWDTGNLRANIQPEKTWTFDKLISLRPNWDLEETLTIPAPE